MIKQSAYLWALAFCVAASPGVASEFGDACLGAQIFTRNDCTCMEGKASDAEKVSMLTALNADKVQASGGKVNEAAANEGMATMSRYVEQCSKQ
jgi:hypothetical protein